MYPTITKSEGISAKINFPCSHLSKINWHQTSGNWKVNEYEVPLQHL
uniref:Uncharacterized protein n=1 Tax=Arundo donax TaxID=35708 RepID=A0A0A9E4Z0_ARUDO